MDSLRVAVEELWSFLILAALDSSEKTVEDPVAGGTGFLCASACVVVLFLFRGSFCYWMCDLVVLRGVLKETTASKYLSCSRQRRTLSGLEWRLGCASRSSGLVMTSG